MLKIRAISIIRFWIAAILIVDYCFFYLIKLPRGILNAAISSGCKIGVTLLTLLLLIFCLRYPQYREIIKENSIFAKRYLITYIISISLVYIFTVLKYNNSPFLYTVKYVFDYLVILLFLPINIILCKDEKEDGIYKILNIIAFIWYIVIVMQIVVYALGGGFFITRFSDGANMREGRLRIGLGSLGNFMILYNFFNFVKDRKKHFCLANFMLGLILAIFIQQTRVMTITLFCCLAAILSTENNSIRKLLKSLLFALFSTILLVRSNYLAKLIGTFSSIDYAGSVSARIYAVEYFLEVFRNNPLFGFGFVSGEDNYRITNGPYGLAYANDVGFIGQMAILGIFAFVIYAPLLIRIVQIVIQLFKYHDEETALMLSYLIYIFLTSGTLIILDAGRIALLPFVLALFEFKARIYDI